MTLPAWIKQRGEFVEMDSRTIGSSAETSLVDFKEIRAIVSKCNKEKTCWLLFDPVTNRATSVALKVNAVFKNAELVKLAKDINVRWGIARHIEDAKVLQQPWFKAFLFSDCIRLTLLGIEYEKKLDISDAYANCEADDDGWTVFETRPRDKPARATAEILSTTIIPECGHSSCCEDEGDIYNWGLSQDKRVKTLPTGHRHSRRRR